jgi:uncharacterized membrane protein YdfJ with MMPL/SSD domain
MERQAYDLMSSGFGPGFNGPLLIASALHPKAKTDPAVTAQENQLKKLQKELDQEQKQGNQMAADLKSGQASLEAQQAQLEREQANLNAQAAKLQSEQASLEAQQAALTAQANQLNAERNRLIAEANALKQKAKSLVRRLVGLGLEKHHLEKCIAANNCKGPDPQGHLRRVEAALKQTTQQLHAVEHQAKKLVRQARALEAQAAQLERQKQSLESQAAVLQQQAASLQQQGNALQQQGDALQQQADALQAEKAQLDALQAKAAKQQKQAEQLHSQLEKTLTKAGGDARATDPRLVKLQNALINTKGDQLVSPPELNKKGNAAVYTVIATTAPSATATANLVKKLRSTVIPNNTSGGLIAFVGGSTAGNVDLANEITNRLPLVIITILVLSMLVLLVAFRSVLIPLQAALTNLLTALAAFGIVTACFQWGWGINLISVATSAHSVPIASYVPLMMFAILFGLSMDYQVFLLSSIDHQRAEGLDDRAAVGAGLKMSARVIAAAALIMISVFSSFILNGDPVVKQFGVGLASAVALAATMVLMLAPAVLVLLGRWAWWMPRLLGKVVPKVDIEGTGLTEHAPPARSVPETASGE